MEHGGNFFNTSPLNSFSVPIPTDVASNLILNLELNLNICRHDRNAFVQFSGLAHGSLILVYGTCSKL